MDRYTIKLDPLEVADQLRQAPAHDYPRIRDAITALRDNPRPSGVTKIKGSTFSYRIRVGNWRILYIIDDAAKLVILFKVDRRNEQTYR